ncbi:Uncharacterised protein [Mycobacteroides abscessus subsp. abscessus]|nr:Uncharacterised protein [Mycobacteroides abscessus subsp. abscessus]
MNGCATTTRSGRVQSPWISLGVKPDELLVKTVSGGAEASIAANSVRLTSMRSGPASKTMSTRRAASAASST